MGRMTSTLTRRAGIIKPSNKECIELGNRSNIWEVTKDPVRGFGTRLMPGDRLSRDVEGGILYADWNQDSQESLTEVDFCIFHDAVNIGDDDIGYSATGTVVAPNLTWTEVGNMPAGIPRSLDGNTYYFTTTTGFRDLLSGLSTWTIIFKVENWNPTEDYEALIQWAGSDIMRRRTAVAANLEAMAGTTSISTWTTDIPATNTILYIAMWSSAADGVTRAGFIEGNTGSGAGGQPTKWSDFPANKRLSHAAALTLTLSDAAPEIYRDATNNNREMKADIYWSIWDSTCLIDNNN